MAMKVSKVHFLPQATVSLSLRPHPTKPASLPCFQNLLQRVCLHGEKREYTIQRSPPMAQTSPSFQSAFACVSGTVHSVQAHMRFVTQPLHHIRVFLPDPDGTCPVSVRQNATQPEAPVFPGGVWGAHTYQPSHPLASLQPLRRTQQAPRRLMAALDPWTDREMQLSEPPPPPPFSLLPPENNTGVACVPGQARKRISRRRSNCCPQLWLATHALSYPRRQCLCFAICM